MGLLCLESFQYFELLVDFFEILDVLLLGSCNLVFDIDQFLRDSIELFWLVSLLQFLLNMRITEVPHHRTRFRSAGETCCPSRTAPAPQ